MRKLCLILTGILLAVCAFAGPQYVALEVSYGTTHTNVLTDVTRVIGYVDEVYFQAPSEAGVTAVVTVVSNPNVGSSLASTLLYTNATLTAAVKARPRIAQTDTAGTDLTSLTVPERFLCLGDPLTLTVDQTSAVTGVTFKAWVKIIQ